MADIYIFLIVIWDTLLHVLIFIFVADIVLCTNDNDENHLFGYLRSWNVETSRTNWASK